MKRYQSFIAAQCKHVDKTLCYSFVEDIEYQHPELRCDVDWQPVKSLEQRLDVLYNQVRVYMNSVIWPGYPLFGVLV